MEKDWDTKAWDNRFRDNAKSCEIYLKEIASKLPSQPSYEYVHDEYLAKYFINNHLQSRTFLDSREALMAKLLDMKNNPHVLYGAIHEEDYLLFYNKEIDAIISDLEE